MYSTNNEGKSVVTERFTRTLKSDFDLPKKILLSA